MCLDQSVTDLGPADACLDLARRELIYTPGLSVVEQQQLARRLLAGEGVQQPPAGWVRCLCGARLTVPGVDERAAG